MNHEVLQGMDGQYVYVPDVDEVFTEAEYLAIEEACKENTVTPS